MSPSIYLAKLIGPVAVAVAMALFLQRDAFRAMARDFLHSAPLIYLSGFLTMVGGLAIVLSHSVWTADWRLLITLLGWLMTIGGASRMICPALARNLGDRMLAHPTGLTIAGAVWLAIGLLLCFFGYIR